MTKKEPYTRALLLLFINEKHFFGDVINPPKPPIVTQQLTCGAQRLFVASNIISLMWSTPMTAVTRPRIRGFDDNLTTSDAIHVFTGYWILRQGV
jgi:hypothetical protein